LFRTIFFVDTEFFKPEPGDTAAAESSPLELDTDGSKMKDLRFAIIQALRDELKFQTLSEIATNLNVTVVGGTGMVNKGWVGQTLDRLVKTPQVNARLPDGTDFELKSVSGTINSKTGMWEPKETMAITMLSAERMIQETFETSAVWHKLSRLILVGHVYEDSAAKRARIVRISPIDVSDPELVTSLKTYWKLIQDTVRNGNITEYSSRGTSEGFLQLRTKGPGGDKGKSTCPVTGRQFNSRAFYATKPFLRYVLGVID
jgi:DNA mismatch repair protein MutH